MNKKIAIFLTAALVILGILIAWAVYSWPVKVKENMSGILTRGGIASYEKEMEVVIDGHYIRKLFKDNEFLGTLNVPDLELDGNYDRTRTVSITFDANGRGHLYYLELDQDGLPMATEYVAMVYMDIKESEIAIAIHESTSPGSSGWGSSGGLILAAPATDRKQAVEITNRLMDDILIIPIR